MEEVSSRRERRRPQGFLGSPLCLCGQLGLGLSASQTRRLCTPCRLSLLISGGR